MRRQYEERLEKYEVTINKLQSESNQIKKLKSGTVLIFITLEYMHKDIEIDKYKKDLQHMSDQVKALERIVFKKDQWINTLANKLLLKDQVHPKPKNHVSPKYQAFNSNSIKKKDLKINCTHGSRSAFSEVRLTDENFNTLNSKTPVDKNEIKDLMHLIDKVNSRSKLKNPNLNLNTEFDKYMSNRLDSSFESRKNYLTQQPTGVMFTISSHH